MFMPTLSVVLLTADRAQLRALVANGNTPQKLAVRAQIMLMLADHVRPSHVATRLGLGNLASAEPRNGGQRHVVKGHSELPSCASNRYDSGDIAPTSAISAKRSDHPETRTPEPRH